MVKKKILVLGNDPQINRIKFKLLGNNVKTFGVNRIFLAHYPSYYFFHDAAILTELEQQPDILETLKEKSNIFSSDWLLRNKKNNRDWINVLRRSSQTNHYFPDSITTGLRLLSYNYIDRSKYIFYLAGISLKWTSPSHFWKELNYPGLNKANKAWYDVRFSKMLDNFKRLKNIGFNMVSVNPNSELNKILRYESINNLYTAKV